MNSRQVVLSGVFLLGLASAYVMHLDAAPRVSQDPPSPRILLVSSELQAVKIEPLKTLDRTSVYQLTIALREDQKFQPGTIVEYEVHATDGTAVGGGMFSVEQQMLSPGGDTLTVLTGFSGMKLHSRQLMLFKLAEAIFTPSRPPSGGPSEKQIITDTCTTFCDSCGDRAEALCTSGASTYSCECSDTSRSCEFTCQSGGSPAKPPV